MKLYFKSSRKWERLQMPDNIIVRKITPIKFSLSCFLWHVLSWLTFGKVVEYQIIDKEGGKVLSKAQVSPRVLTLPFIPKGGYHIGPCATLPSERGKGYYPLLLQRILEENPRKDFYMVIDETNTASIKGVKKVGFELFAKGIKKHHRYVKIPF